MAPPIFHSKRLLSPFSDDILPPSSPDAPWSEYKQRVRYARRRRLVSSPTKPRQTLASFNQRCFISSPTRPISESPSPSPYYHHGTRSLSDPDSPILTPPTPSPPERKTKTTGRIRTPLVGNSRALDRVHPGKGVIPSSSESQAEVLQEVPTQHSTVNNDPDEGQDEESFLQQRREHAREYARNYYQQNRAFLQARARENKHK
ncbi:hypothetical protein VNI00_014225 [Paramarasmius palmivorus]|uniref:Uncharacterized protein n=1 Tax=Paramarasmius palmivorus TaxID=297713 RepID=A0AAW0BW73_9AGAR